MKIGKCFHNYGEIEHYRSDIITIGDFVVLSAGAVIITHCPISFYKPDQPSITIGDNVFIGKRSVILPGANIGSNVMIGAGSVVAGTIPSNSVAMGNPCVVARSITDKEALRMRLMTEQNVVGDGKEPAYEGR